MSAKAEMHGGAERKSGLGEYVQHLSFYLKKRGLLECLRLAWKRFWIGRLGQWEWLYFADLPNASLSVEESEAKLTLVSYENETQAERALLSNLSNYKSRRTASLFLSRWFSRGATLWASMIGDELVGLQWTLQGGFDGFYSVPIHSQEVIIVAVEVFQPFKGKGLYPRMLSQLVARLQEAGGRRAYLKVASSNRSMLRSMSKTPFQKMGRVYTFRLFGRWFTIWDKQ